ncbi:Tanc1, partial [Symbiodinium microadriaticum]
DPDVMCGRRPALCVAAAKGHLEVVRLLQQAHASVNNADAQGRGPLQIAASGQHDALVKSLVDGAADVNHQDLGGRSAFLWACLRGHIGIAGCLKKASADVNCTLVLKRLRISIEALPFENMCLLAPAHV